MASSLFLQVQRGLLGEMNRATPVLVLLALSGLHSVSASDLVIGPASTQTLDPGTVTSAAVIRVQGTLRCGATLGVALPAATLRTSRVVVEGGGAFECGSASKTASLNLELLDSSDTTLGGLVDDTQRGIVVDSGGRLSLHADPARSRVARLSSVARRGSARLHLRAPGVGSYWQVGDDLVVATTSFNAQPSIGQNEERTITAISTDGLVVDLDRPLTFEHYGGRPATFTGSALTLDEAGYVANLRRPIRIRPAADAAAGGHIIVHHGGSAYVQGVEISRLGDQGTLGHYPFHWHRAGNVSGQYFRESSVHHTRQRCIVVHGVSDAQVLSNTCFDVVGHGIFLEDGDEVANVVADNLVVLARKASADTLLLQSELRDADIQRFPSPAAIWVSHPDNVITDNVAIASEGTGIWFSFVNHICCVPSECTVFRKNHRPSAADCVALHGPAAQLIHPSTAPTRANARNVAACNVVGINWVIDAPPHYHTPPSRPHALLHPPRRMALRTASSPTTSATPPTAISIPATMRPSMRATHRRSSRTSSCTKTRTRHSTSAAASRIFYGKCTPTTAR